MSFVKTVFIFAAFILSPQLFAAPRATIEVSSTVKNPGKLELAFKTIPTGDLVINKDGPWKLEIKDQGSLKFSKTEFKRNEWKEDQGVFVASAEGGKKGPSTIKYKLIAFVCTKDKTQCFRDVFENTATLNW